MNVDTSEINKFSELAHRWWDPSSEFKPLHAINPLRLNWIDGRVGLAGKKVVDIGCGGGILSESMASRGADVKGIDLSERALSVAELHSLESGVAVSYEYLSAEDLAALGAAARIDRRAEHVPDPSAIVKACAQLVKPGGQVFFSTLNRNPKSYLLAILGAEYVLRLLPRGTHDYKKFIKPSELHQMVRSAGLELQEIRGMSYNPFTEVFRLNSDTDVNYMIACSK